MRIHDRDQIRRLLNADRAWSVYALGDLAPGFYEQAEWHAAPGPVPALLLLYRVFATPVLFTLGPVEAVAPLLDDIQHEPALYLSIRPEILPAIEARWQVSGATPMWRMLLDPSRFRPAPGVVRRLGPADLPALEALYADGQAAGEAPDFFTPAMLAEGVFFGVEEDSALAAAAGTHLVVPSEGVAAIGNVYTRRDRRGRGLARQVTAAVAAELLGDPGSFTVALNVSQANARAVRVYESLGFVKYCAFYEGMAKR